MAFTLQDLIDLKQFQVLQDRLNEIYAFPSSIIDNEGNILTATAWQDICTKFHRRHPECEKECIKSDQYILRHLQEADPAVTYRCPHGLVDNATPIIIEGIHYGNFFTGQFFLEAPDPEFFRAQADKYGFDEEAYLDAVRRVPVWTQEQLNSYLFFIKGLIAIISESGLKRLHEIEHRKQIDDTTKNANTILQTAMDGFCRFDCNERLIEVNDAYCRMSGYSREELLTMSVSDLDVKESAEELSAHFKQLVRNQSSRFESLHRRKDGSIFDVEISTQYLSGMNGGLIVFIRDIAERKQAEVLLTARAELTELAQSAGLDALVQVALDKAELLTHSSIGFFHFVEKDQEHLRLQQWSTNTIRHMCTAEGKGRHYPVSEAGVWVDCLAAREPVLHNDYASLPHRKGLPPGHAPIVRELVVPILRDGLVVAILGVGNKPADYTAEDVKLVEQLAGIVVDNALRKQAEDAARESREMLQTIFENSSIALDVFDKNGVLVVCNKRVCDLFGMDAKSQIGQYNLRDSQLNGEDIWTRLKNGEEIRSEILFDFADAPFVSTRTGRIYLDIITTPVSQDTSDRIGFIRQIMEVTEQKHLQEQLRQVQKLDAIGRLAGGVAHDFNNVLATMMLHLSILRQNSMLDSETQQSLKELTDEAERAANLTRQLLMFSRRAIIDVRLLNMNDVASNLLKMLGRLIGEHIELRFSCSAVLPMVQADPGMMEQVIMNLCVNARDSMPGGGMLSISLSPVTIDETAAQRNTQAPAGLYVRLSVADTGCGMDETTIQHIFEPFFTTKEVGKGTGLGLATVHGIVSQHGGWIDVESAVGQGSVFHVYLPAAAPRTVEPEILEEPIVVGGKETILLAEDEVNLRRITALSLRKIGYRIYESSNGADALAIWKEHHAEIDLLLSDMVMPGGMTGLAFAGRIRADNPALKVILVSGYNAEKAPGHAAADSSIVFVQKPYTLESLSIAVRDCLDGK